MPMYLLIFYKQKNVHMHKRKHKSTLYIHVVLKVYKRYISLHRPGLNPSKHSTLKLSLSLILTRFLNQSLSLYFSVCLCKYVSPSLSMYVCLYKHLSFSVYVCLAICLTVSLSVRQPHRPSVWSASWCCARGVCPS